MIVAYRDGAPVRLRDVANVIDSVQDDKQISLIYGGEYGTEGTQGISLSVMRQPGTNTIEVVDRIRALIPTFEAEMPPTVHLGIRGRSGTASGSTTDGKSASAASETKISTCSQQICFLWPNGIQHWEYTRSVIERSPGPLIRTTMARAGCSGMSAAMVSPRLCVSSSSSLITSNVIEQARSTPAPPSAALAVETHNSASSFRILSGATVALITVSSTRAHSAPAFRPRPPVPRCPIRSWGNRTWFRATRFESARRPTNWLPPCPAACTAWRRR